MLLSPIYCAGAQIKHNSLHPSPRGSQCSRALGPACTGSCIRGGQCCCQHPPCPGFSLPDTLHGVEPGPGSWALEAAPPPCSAGGQSGPVLLGAPGVALGWTLQQSFPYWANRGAPTGAGHCEARPLLSPHPPCVQQKVGLGPEPRADSAPTPMLPAGMGDLSLPYPWPQFSTELLLSCPL